MEAFVRALRLTIHIGHADVAYHLPLAFQLLHRLHQAGMSGATALHGIEGYGRSGKIHDIPRWGVIDRAPVIVVVIDAPERIREFLPHLDDLADRCLITLDEVEAREPRTDVAGP